MGDSRSPFDRSHTSSIVTKALSCIFSKIMGDIGQKSGFFHTPFYITTPRGKTVRYFCAVFSQLCQMTAISGGEVVILQKELYSLTAQVCYRQTARHTDRQTDMWKSDLSSRVYYVMLANNVAARGHSWRHIFPHYYSLLFFNSNSNYVQQHSYC